MLSKHAVPYLDSEAKWMWSRGFCFLVREGKKKCFVLEISKRRRGKHHQNSP